MAAGGVQEVHEFLGGIGLEQCVQAVVQNGFYTSMEALRGATYEELVDSGVRPVHAKLILSNLGSKSLGSLALGEKLPGDVTGASAEEVDSFLRSVGLEGCLSALSDAGFTSLDHLGRASLQDLLSAGIKPVHARLIVSNLDSASSAGINMTPATQRMASLDEETLLGGPRKRRTSPKLLAGVGAFVLLLLLALWFLMSSGSPAVPPSPSSPAIAGRAGRGHGGGGANKGGANKGGANKGGASKGGTGVHKIKSAGKANKLAELKAAPPESKAV